LFQCACGNKKTIRAGNVKSGKTRSCGCLQREAAAKLAKKIRHAPGASVAHSLFCRARALARRRNIAFELKENQFVRLIGGSCFYCGAPPRAVAMKRYYGQFLANGLDRIDSSAGYIENNVVACCRVCNAAKGALTVTVFKEWVIRVYTHLNYGRKH
jgi:5-methylcytosine-specific restriction endonuclease McrA